MRLINSREIIVLTSRQYKQYEAGKPLSRLIRNDAKGSEWHLKLIILALDIHWKRATVINNG